MEVVKLIYGLPTSRNMLHAHLLHTLRAMIFKPGRLDPDFWIRGSKVGYDYIGKYTNDVLVVAVKPTSVFNKLNDTYTIKSFVPPKGHLGCDYSQVNKSATTKWVMVSSTYTTESLRKLCALIKFSTFQKEKLSRSPSDHTKLYLSPLLGNN